MSTAEVTITAVGPMGLNVATATRGGSIVHSVVAGGLADAAGVRAGDMISSVNEQDVSELDHVAVLDAIRVVGRPLRLTLAREEVRSGGSGGSGGGDGGASFNSGLFSGAPADAARAAGTKAAGILKGLLGAAVNATVSGIKGVDKLIESTLDSGMKSAVSHATVRLEHAGAEEESRMGLYC